MKIEAVPAGALPSLVESLSDLRHDLGKYICFETRFVGVDADAAALREALRADLLATRRRGDAVEPATAVWARLRPQVLDGDPDVVIIDAAMAGIAAFDPDGPEAALRETAGLALSVADATRRLLSRARAAGGGNVA